MSRGRGRGRGSSLSFNIEAIGFSRGEALPTSLLQPPPDYPPLKRQPVQLLTGEDQTYLLALQHNFEKRMRSSPYYIRKQEERNFLKKYSDKYKKSTHSDDDLGWEADWKRIPDELKIKKKILKVKKKVPKIKKVKALPDEVLRKKLDELEKKDTENPDEAKKKEEEKEDGSDAELEVEDIEEDEDDNDYLNSYFDNGESFLDEEEDALEDKDGGIY